MIKKNLHIQVIVSAFLAVFCLFGYRTTFAILKDPMVLSLGWSQTEISFGYSAMMLIYAVTAYLSGIILDKFGPKPVYMVSAIFGGAGFILTSITSQFYFYLFSFGIIGGVATGLLWVTATISVRKWFVGHKFATMWGFAFAGAPLSQWLMSELTKYILSGNNNEAWREAMMILGILVCFLLLLAMVFSKKSPENYNLKPAGIQINTSPKKDIHWKISAAFRQSAIWLIILMFMTSMISEFLLWTQLVSFWIDEKGYTSATAISIYKSIGIAGLFTMPLLGIVADRLVKKIYFESLARKVTLIAGPAIGLISCGILLIPGDYLSLSYISAILFATYWAIVPGGVVGYTGSMFGSKSLGKIWGLSTLIVMGAGPFLGTLVGGLIKDYFGNYSYAIYFAIASFFVSLILAAFLPIKLKSE